MCEASFLVYTPWIWKLLEI